MDRFKAIMGRVPVAVKVCSLTERKQTVKRTTYKAEDHIAPESSGALDPVSALDEQLRQVQARRAARAQKTVRDAQTQQRLVVDEGQRQAEIARKYPWAFILGREHPSMAEIENDLDRWRRVDDAMERRDRREAEEMGQEANRLAISLRP